MGTYNNSVDELVDVIWFALDDVEGDFDRATLRAALSKCRNYQPTMDDYLRVPTWWKPWTWGQGYWFPVKLNARLKTRLKETVYLQQRERLVKALRQAHECPAMNCFGCRCEIEDALESIGEKV